MAERFAVRVPYYPVECKAVGLVGPCHECLRATNGKGYSIMGDGDSKVLVHRWVWEQIWGTIPNGMQIDHMCRNRRCCNVDHLRLVTPAKNQAENSNSAAAMNYKKTHCCHGHEFTDENTKTRERNGRLERSCRTCDRLHRQKKKHREREMIRVAKGIVGNLGDYVSWSTGCKATQSAQADQPC